MKTSATFLAGVLVGAALAIGVAAGASGGAAAQQLYQAPNPNEQLAAAPPASSYDPYTSGIGACVQANWGNSPPCRETMQPTSGQPNYWPYH